MKLKVVVFDAYGTLFDVCSIQVLAETYIQTIEQTLL